MNAEEIRAEGTVFARYLSGRTPSAYVIGKYLAAHEAGDTFAARTPSDRWLVVVAQTSTLAARLSDSFARLFMPRSVLRRKLSLTLAILETAPKDHATIDGARTGSVAVSVARLALYGFVGTLTAIAAAIVLLPLRALAAITGRGR